MELHFRNRMFLSIKMLRFCFVLFLYYFFVKFPYIFGYNSEIIPNINLKGILIKIHELFTLSFVFNASVAVLMLDAFEALVGAMYLEKGYKFTQHVVIDRLINIYMDIDNLANSDWNFKSKLIDWGQKERKKVSFEVVQVISVGSRKQYETRVLVDGVPHESAIEFSIKAAEQLAAEKTYKKMFGPGGSHVDESNTSKE